MSFIATAPSSTTTPSASIVTNDGFFPDIDMDALREAVRLDGTVTAARLRDATIAAVIEVNNELQAYRARQVAAGVTALAQLQPQIGGVSVAVSQYLAAVYRTAKADLTERYRDFDTTKLGKDRADHLEGTIDDDRRAARWAIRDLLGKPRSTIELI
jgi:hypothetical protein